VPPEPEPPELPDPPPEPLEPPPPEPLPPPLPDPPEPAAGLICRVAVASADWAKLSLTVIVIVVEPVWESVGVSVALQDCDDEPQPALSAIPEFGRSVVLLLCAVTVNAPVPLSAKATGLGASGSVMLCVPPAVMPTVGAAGAGVPMESVPVV